MANLLQLQLSKAQLSCSQIVKIEYTVIWKIRPLSWRNVKTYKRVNFEKKPSSFMQWREEGFVNCKLNFIRIWGFSGFCNEFQLMSTNYFTRVSQLTFYYNMIEMIYWLIDYEFVVLCGTNVYLYKNLSTVFFFH